MKIVAMLLGSTVQIEVRAFQKSTIHLLSAKVYMFLPSFIVVKTKKRQKRIVDPVAVKFGGIKKFAVQHQWKTVNIIQ